MACLTYHYYSCSTKLGSGDATTPLCNFKLIRSTVTMYYLIPYALQNLYEEISQKDKLLIIATVLSYFYPDMKIMDQYLY